MKNNNKIKQSLLSIVLSLVMLVAASGLVACGNADDTQVQATKPQASDNQGQSTKTQSSDNGVYINESFDRENMKTIYGAPYVIEGNDNAIYEKTNGLGLELTEEMTQERQSEAARFGLFIASQMIGATYTTDAAIASLPSDAEYEAMTEEEQTAVFEKYNQQTVYLFAVMKINNSNEEETAYFDRMMEKYQKADMLYTADGYTYYFAYSDDMSNFEISDAEEPTLTAFVNSLETIKESICLFTPEEYVEPDTSAESFEGTLKDLSTVTMSGEAVDASIFADYDVTMVNVWATWCSPCVGELPELQELYAQLPENVNMISICSDASSETELAQQMIDELGLEFTTLMDSESLVEDFISYCSAYPTTVFVDSEGNPVGQLMVGVPNGDVIAAYSALIDVALQSAAQ